MKDNHTNCAWKVLIAYDGSKDASEALQATIKNMNKMIAAILILGVVQPGEPPIVNGKGSLQEASRLLADQLESATISASEDENRIDIRTEIAIGDPTEEILKLARRDQCDLIVLGRRGNSSFGKPVLGSVAEKIAQYSECAVLIAQNQPVLNLESR